MDLQKDRFMTLNVMGVPVTIKKMECLSRTWFCAYAELKDSHVLSDDFLGYPTYRGSGNDKDIVGIDTAHAFNEGQALHCKLRSAIEQIEDVIKCWKSATGGDQ